MTAALGIILRGGVDPDASRFFAAAGITVSQQRNAVNRLTKNLKSAGLWPLLVGFWPLVGGTAASHAENLVSANFPVAWGGTVTHNANGITGNGTDGHGIMIGANSSLTLTNCAFGVYTKTVATAGNRVDFGGTTDATNWIIIRSRAGGGFDYLIGNTSAGAGPDSDNIPGVRIVASNGTISQYQNGTAIGSPRTAAGSMTAHLNFLRANTVGDYSNSTLSAGFSSQYLTAAQAATMTTIIANYQAALGR